MNEIKNSTMKATDRGIKCLQCNKKPGFTKVCIDTGQVYWALECDCKSTDHYRSKMWAVAEWEESVFKAEPSDRLRNPEVYT